MSITLRPASDADAATISIVLSSGYQHDYPVKLARELREEGFIRHHTIATRDDGVAVGYAALINLARPNNWATLGLLCVSHAVRREGVGGKLVVATLDAARATKADAVLVLGDVDYFKRFQFVQAAAANLQTSYAKSELSLYAIAPGTALSDATVEFPEPYRR